MAANPRPRRRSARACLCVVFRRDLPHGRRRRQTVSCCRPDQLIRIVNKAPARAQRGPAFLRAARPSTHKPVPSAVGGYSRDHCLFAAVEQSLVNREPWNAPHALLSPAALSSLPKKPLPQSTNNLFDKRNFFFPLVCEIFFSTTVK